ncbi:MAG: FAD-binding protein, partial [Syntrophales bacterium]|nr:FAD-binding protein [Syntrophales bacterium]
MEEKKIKEAYKELAKIVGEQYVSMDKEDIMPYCRDEVSQAFKTYMADLVAAPGTVEEIQEILRLCNKIKLPVYPYAYGVSISSTALPRVGGLMLVVRRL